VLAFVVRRLFWAVMLALIITLYTFLIFFVIPTDTRSTLSGRGQTDPTLQGQFNLRGQSVESQYVHFVEHLVRHGDLGRDSLWAWMKGQSFEGVRLVSVDDTWSAFWFKRV